MAYSEKQDVNLLFYVIPAKNPFVNGMQRMVIDKKIQEIVYEELLTKNVCKISEKSTRSEIFRFLVGISCGEKSKSDKTEEYLPINWYTGEKTTIGKDVLYRARNMDRPYNDIFVLRKTCCAYKYVQIRFTIMKG